MIKDRLFLVATACLSIWLLMKTPGLAQVGGKLLRWVTPSPAKEPYPTPDDDFGLGDKLENTLANPKDGVFLGAMMWALAETIEYDGTTKKPYLVTTSNVAQLDETTKSIYLKGGDIGSGAFSAAMSGAIEKAIGKEAKPLTPELRKKASAVHRAAAWSLQ